MLSDSVRVSMVMVGSFRFGSRHDSLNGVGDPIVRVDGWTVRAFLAGAFLAGVFLA